MRKDLLFVVGVVLLAFVVPACGEDEAATHQHTDSSHWMGEPAEAGEADRTIEVVMHDKMAYEPPSLEVEQGEVITFKVTNKGKLRHEFVLGDEAFQTAHDDAMGSGGHVHPAKNGISLEGGASGSLTWRFTQTGEVLYGCHQPGHYDAGMVGTIEVS